MRVVHVGLVRQQGCLFDQQDGVLVGGDGFPGHHRGVVDGPDFQVDGGRRQAAIAVRDPVDEAGRAEVVTTRQEANIAVGIEPDQTMLGIRDAQDAQHVADGGGIHIEIVGKQLGGRQQDAYVLVHRHVLARRDRHIIDRGNVQVDPA
ncbi:hypothetical protein D3C72_1811580 [compost metagenome]